jgi:hypothetical protein
VRDEQDGEAELPVEVAQELEDGAGGLRVEGAGGLVGEQDLGIAGEGAGDADALLLAAGELAGVGLGLVGEADQVEEFQGPAGALGAGDAEDLQGEVDVVLDRAGGQQLKCWKTMPMLLRARRRSLPARRPFPARAVRSTPSTVTVPEVGRSRRLTQRMSEDLPAPLWPITPNTSPSRTWRSTPSRAVTCRPRDS